MLNTILPNDFRWNRLQEPARPSAESADFMRLLSALDSGWKILNPVRVMNCYDSHGGQVFGLVLYHPATGKLLELVLGRKDGVERLLHEENAVIIAEKPIKN